MIVDGRSILFDIHIDTSVMSIMVLYVPNNDSPLFFEGVRERLKNRSEKKLVY